MSPKFRKALARLLRIARRTPPQFKARFVKAVPMSAQPNTIYVVGDDECVWAAALVCPCGCREIIHLSLVRDASPSWRVQVNGEGVVTLLPSVWRTTGCRSHFVIYRGRLLSCRKEPDLTDADHEMDANGPVIFH